MTQLTKDQEAAKAAFTKLILDNEQEVLVIKGSAGTGKTFLVNDLLRSLPKTMKMAEVVTGEKLNLTSIHLCASTNKAANALHEATGCDAKTVHSLLSLMPRYDAKTGKSILLEKSESKFSDALIVVDEASMIDSELLQIIMRRCPRSKILFIGDPYQLTNPGDSTTPVFGAGFITVELTKVVRQAKDNPIIGLAQNFKEVLLGNAWPKIPPTPEIVHLSLEDFLGTISTEFNRDNWSTSCSRVLANTNRTVEQYNDAIRVNVTGRAEFKVGDWVINNAYSGGNNHNIPTDTAVQIESISKSSERLSSNKFSNGHRVTLVGVDQVLFMPEMLSHKKKAINHFRKEKRWDTVSEINSTWVDLRSPYASTVYKAQGSTYSKVFIDVNDISQTCKDPNQIARLLYVAVSRASHQVIMTGDLTK